MTVVSEKLSSFDLAQEKSQQYHKRAQRYVCNRQCAASGDAVLCLKYSNDEIYSMYEDGTKCTTPVTPANRT